MSSPQSDPANPYVPDYRLEGAYDEANLLDERGLEALCPSYLELAENEMRYRDEALLGEGSVKQVYKSWDSRSRRWVAMARLREDRGPELYDQFVHEAWLASSLSHPNIIKVYDVGVDGDGRPFFTMDLKGETTLADLLRQRSMQDRRKLLGIFLRICDAVASAHARGIVHLDLKPENIQADRYGDVLVCDWGLGKAIASSPSAEESVDPAGPFIDNMTLQGTVKGTPGYMAPEQLDPEAAKDERTDVFALGCILHAILTGAPPFHGRPKQELIDAMREASFPPPRLRYPQRMIPESLEAVVMKACSRRPEERYPSALELRREVEKFLDGFATTAEEPGFLKAAALFVARHRAASAICLLAVIAIGMVSGVFLHRLNRQQAATDTQRSRAIQSESRADQLVAQYQSELAASDEERVRLAARLAESANTLKNLGIFESPAKSVREANELAGLALKLDPDCEQAQIERFALACIQLDFRTALGRRPDVEYRFSDYASFAEAFPNWSFSGDTRPAVAQLAAFYRRAREINPSREALMERILSYDVAVRRNTSDYDEVIIALLEYLNGGRDHVIANYNREESSFFAWSDRDLRLRIPEGSGSGRCVLRYLPIRSLQLDVAGTFALADLHLLQIESLDLRRCPNVNLSRPVSLPLLREIHLPAGSAPENFRRWIQTSQRLQFVEDAP